MEPLILLAGVAAAAGAHATLIATRELRTSRIDATIQDLPAAFNGYTISVLADLHHRPGSSPESIRRAIEAVTDARPDLILLLGDYSWSYKESRELSMRLYDSAMRSLVPELTRLTAPDGVIAVLGNHDYYSSAERTAAALRSAGIRVLVNEAVRIERGGCALQLVGLDDAIEGSIDPAAAFAGMAEGIPTIVLSHNPDGIFSLPPDRRVDLVLSGHTHGGQIVIPGYGAPVTFSRACRRHTASGWIPNTRAPLYVTRGVCCQVPVRFNCPPELLIVRLTPAAPRGG